QAETDSGDFELITIDLEKIAIDAREEEAKQLSIEEARRPFDLSRGPLFRAALLKLDEQEHFLLLSVHHVIFDVWSLGVFFKELSALYTAFIEGKRSPLEELTIQYTDFARWQRDWLQGRVLEKQLEYWKKRLHNAPVVLDLPVDRRRPSSQTYVGARL